MKHEGQAAIVTGGGQGIGRAVVERLAAEGARVAVLDMNPDNAKEVIEGLDTPINHLALQTNVADSASVIASIRQARETFGRLDMAVNN
ncbi:MAG: SDR family NAD(P)-dependent oxidoreductase, partial [Pseudomonadota bacterium]|nr:SDR family NAD(P)-dependent oxidoreductase [Pseudomonadota bacterium]